MVSYRSSISILLVLILSTLVSAQTGFELNNYDRSEFDRRRNMVMDATADGVVVLMGEYNRLDYMRWRQNNSFYYLTGVEIPDAVLVLDSRNRAETLFLAPARSGNSAIFDGTTLGPGPAAERYFGVDRTRPLSELQAYISGLDDGVRFYINQQPAEVLAGASASAAYTREKTQNYPWGGAVSREAAIENWLEGLKPGSTFIDVYPVLSELRRVKSDWEIDRIVEACRVAGEGHLAAMQATGPGTMEYEVEAAATAGFIGRGGFYPGYAAIVGSGPNNNILHYSLSSRKMKSGELVLMDFGPDYRYYVADITRTWPVDAQFTARHKTVYADLLAVQKELIRTLKPGDTFRTLNARTYTLLEEKGYGDNVYHGVSHYLGMSVHDVGASALPFEPGTVITIEPGVYFMEEGWGIRIEDVVLITATGAVNLSAMIPKETEDIENIRSSNPTGEKEVRFEAGRWQYEFITNYSTGQIHKKKRLLGSN